MTPAKGFAEMKDSGAEWIKEIPANWELSKIGALYTQRNEKVSDKDYPPLSVTMKGILPQLATAAKTDDGDNRKLVRIGDFAINSRSDRRGSCGISPYDGSVSLINTILTPRKKMHPGYYNWLFHTTLFADEFYKWGHGIVDDLWTTRWQEMKRILVPVPPYETQSAIASYLDAQCAKIDEIIAQAKASIEDYRQWKASIIYEAVTKGLDPNVEMKDSGIEWIKQIPQHWGKSKIKKVAQAFNGDRSSNYPSGDDIVSSGILFITSNNLGAIELNIGIPSNKYITPQKYNELRGAKVQINDIVFCLRGSVGKCSINKQIMEGTIASSLVVIRAESINPDYLNYVLQNSAVSEMALTTAIGIGSLNLSAENIMSFVIPLPSPAEQSIIVRYLNHKCKTVEGLITEKQSLIDDLESYKKSLIYEVVTGKRSVRQ